MEKKYFNTKDAAAFLGIKLSTLYRYIWSNAVVYYKPHGRFVYFLKEDLENFISKGRVASQEEVEAQAIEEICLKRGDK